MARVILTHRAQSDLDEIWLHIAMDNPVAADDLIDAITEHASIIATQPLTGRTRPELAPELRSFPERSYVIFYEPISDGIRIIRVLHGARDLNAIFSSDIE